MKGNSKVRSSCARETFGLKQAAQSLSQLVDCPDSVHMSLKKLPIFLYTDNLGTAFMFHSQHAQNYITQKYLTETTQLLYQFGQPFEVFWKRRSEPSAVSADLASKLPPWYCTPFLINHIKAFFKLEGSTDFFYPVEPLDLIRLRIGRIPKNFEKYHNIHTQSSQMIVIIPPNLQKNTYRNILECFSQFVLTGFIIIPHLQHKSWFSPLVQRLGTPLKVDTNQTFFQSTIFSTSVRFAFKMAVFRLH